MTRRDARKCARLIAFASVELAYDLTYKMKEAWEFRRQQRQREHEERMRAIEGGPIYIGSSPIGVGL